MPRTKMTDEDRKERISELEKMEAKMLKEPELHKASLKSVRISLASLRRTVAGNQQAAPYKGLPPEPNMWKRIVAEHRSTPQPKKGTEEYKEWLIRKNTYKRAINMLRVTRHNWYANLMKAEASERRKEANKDKLRIRFYDLMNPNSVYESIGDAMKRNRCSRSRVLTLMSKGRYVRLAVGETVPERVMNAYADGTLMDELYKGRDCFADVLMLGSGPIYENTTAQRMNNFVPSKKKKEG